MPLGHARQFVCLPGPPKQVCRPSFQARCRLLFLFISVGRGNLYSIDVRVRVVAQLACPSLKRIRDAFFSCIQEYSTDSTIAAILNAPIRYTMSLAFFCPPPFCCVQHQASNLHVIISRECMHVGTTISFRRDEGSGRAPLLSQEWVLEIPPFFPARPPPPPFSRSSSTRPPLILREEGLPSSSRHAAMMGHKQKRKEEIKPGIRFTIGYPKYRRFLC